MARFIVRRLLWLGPTRADRHVRRVLRDPDRVGSGGRVTCGPTRAPATRRSSSSSRSTVCTRASAATSAATSSGSGTSCEGPDHWPQEHQGRRRGVGAAARTRSSTRCASPASPPCSASLGVAVGILAARKPGGWLDSSSTPSAFFVGAIPPFVSGVVLQLVFAVQLGWLPSAGRVPAGPAGLRPRADDQAPDPAGHRGGHPDDRPVQPLHACLAARRVVGDYLRTARAKGIRERQVLFKHSVRNAMIPVVTLLALDIGAAARRPDHHREHLRVPGHGRVLPERRQDGDFPKLMPFMVIDHRLGDAVQPDRRRARTPPRPEDPP